VECGLNDGILLCVKSAAEFMTLTGRDTQLFAQTADIQAVVKARGGAIVARSK
jgi:sulfur transfer complex TusBCD TusB component (DsrH family)